jgi:hypothetical protein
MKRHVKNQRRRWPAVVLVENVRSDEVAKATAAAAAWAWDSHAIGAARVKGRSRGSLLLDFGGNMLDADELRRLELALDKR